MTDFFTSDTHFGHAKVIEMTGRPFVNVHQMDATLVRNWNDLVTKHDRIFHLGDFGLGNPGLLQEILDGLNGEKHLVCGNHDVKGRKLRGWASVADYREIKSGGRTIVLSHYAMRVWNGCHYGRFMLYGHSHGNLPGNSQSCDVGVDAWAMKPASYEDVTTRMGHLPPFTGYALQAGDTDHHGLRTKLGSA